MKSTARPAMLRGSLITLRRRCGTKTCKCAEGVLHESPALSCKIGGKSHVITLAADEVPVVSFALDRYAKAYEELERACEDGIAWLREQVDARKTKRSGKK